MKEFWHKLYAKQSFFYKIFFCTIVVWSIVYFLPQGNRFGYEIQKGKPWLYESLYAPFDFPLKKLPQEIQQEKKEITEKSPVYFKKDSLTEKIVLNDFNEKFSNFFANDFPQDSLKHLQKKGQEILSEIYKIGVISENQDDSKEKKFITDEAKSVDFKTQNFIKKENFSVFVEKKFPLYASVFQPLFAQILKPNVLMNEFFTQNKLEQSLKKISHTRGIVKKNELIIATGQIIEGEKWRSLKSLEAEYELNREGYSVFNYASYGYFALVGVLVFIILLYLYRFHREVYENNSKITLIFLNIALISTLVGLVLKIDKSYIYAVPIAIIPLVLKAFFDNRIGIFIYIITILITSFIVPDSLQYIFINVSILGVILFNNKQIHYRISLFLIAGYITLSYIIFFSAYNFLNGNHHFFTIGNIGIFIINGFLILFTQPLIYIYEKLFGLVSDISLLELTDTNSKLLRELSEKAPGTFHHCLQVANLAEAAAKEIGANPLLTRVGALYHDIGKMNNPLYFTENQRTSVNLHDEISPKESAKIIINHVTEGIEIARQNKIPDRIIDFIRTHHGNSLVYYFYKKQLDSGEDFKEEDFRYRGPIPFSKETLILMMADSIEAASKSLKNLNSQNIDAFVESIVKKQFNDGQYLNSNITLKEIEKIKKVFKEKLINIHHLRIEYPD